MVFSNPVVITMRLEVLSVELVPDKSPEPKRWDNLWVILWKITSDEEFPQHDHPSHPHQGIDHRTYQQWIADPKSFSYASQGVYGRPTKTQVGYTNSGTWISPVGRRFDPVTGPTRVSELDGKLRLLWEREPLLSALIEANNDELLAMFHRRGGLSGG